MKTKDIRLVETILKKIIKVNIGLVKVVWVRIKKVNKVFVGLVKVIFQKNIEIPKEVLT